MTSHLYNINAQELIVSLKDKYVDVVLTDPMYDLDEETKRWYHNHFCRLARKAVIVFMPPENPWITPADQYLFWIKPISTKNTSKHYSRFVEQIFLYEMEQFEWNCKRHWSQYTNVFTDIVDDTSLHPYRKPPSMLERLIANHTSQGDTVLDPFMGSGTVGAVSRWLGRNFIGSEINPEYFSIAQAQVMTVDDWSETHEDEEYYK